MLGAKWGILSGKALEGTEIRSWWINSQETLVSSEPWDRNSRISVETGQRRGDFTKLWLFIGNVWGSLISLQGKGTQWGRQQQGHQSQIGTSGRVAELGNAMLRSELGSRWRCNLAQRSSKDPQRTQLSITESARLYAHWREVIRDLERSGEKGGTGLVCSVPVSPTPRPVKSSNTMTQVSAFWPCSPPYFLCLLYAGPI